ncbi:MAG: alpha-2-macroglobulin family protein [Oligosphaeraceae bacterium]
MDSKTGQGREDGTVRPAYRNGGNLRAWLRRAPRMALVLSLSGLCAAQESPHDAVRRLMEAGRFAEALATCRTSLAKAGSGGAEAASLLATAVRCLQRLNRLDERDPLVRSELSRRPADWLFLAETHRQVQDVPLGRALWLRQLAPGVGPVSDGVLAPEQQAVFWDELMTTLMRGRDSLWTFWRLQVLTELTADADAPDGNAARRRDPESHWADRASGLPLSATGGALFFASPQSWESAANDGERYAWCLSRLLALLPPAGEPVPPALRAALRRHAEICRRVYGERTAPRGLRQRGADESQDWDDTLARLRDDEALVTLATGQVLRTEIPHEWSALWLYGRLTDWMELARLHEERGQYERAAEQWRRALKEGDPAAQEEARRNLERLEGSWCLLAAPKSGATQVAGQPVRLRLDYRNATSASLTAHQVDYVQMVEELVRRLETGQPWTDPLEMLQDTQSRGRFLRRQVAAWQERLNPQPGHRDTTMLLTAPLREPGAYLVTCTLDGGRACSALVVVQDRLLLLAQDGQLDQSLQLLDAASGQPVVRGEVDFLELLPASADGRKRQGQRLHRERLLSDRDGLLRLPAPQAKGQPVRSRRFLALAMAANGEWLPAMERHVWPRPSLPRTDEQPLRGLAMFDRAIYRPAQDVQARIWLEQGDQALPQGTRLRLTLHAPNGGEALRQELVADAAGGVSLSYRLPPEARLGWYSAEVSLLHAKSRLHVGGFRVEAYRKPDFEVTLDLPDEPPTLGNKVEAIVRAAYYFGAPVADGQLRLTVTRRLQDSGWRWPGPWDWLYARPDAFMPFAPKVAMPISASEETVLRTSGRLAADGTFRVTLDTAEALKLHGDQCHVYDFQAEVEDAGRRVIRASQSLTLSPRPFQAWVSPERGFALVGEPVRVRLQARTAQGKPVAGSGTLRLFRRTVLPDGTLAETHERSWEASPDAEGRAGQTLSASRPGSYRLEWRVTARGETVAGDARLNIYGEGYDGRDFQCQGLEATTDRHEYAVGDTARILVTAEQSGSAVMMVRSGADGQRRPVQVLRLSGRAQLVEIPLTQDDVPETQCRFYLVREGVLHETLVSLAVPPVASRLHVDAQAEPSAAVPDGDCRLRLRVTDSQGRPAASTHLVVTVYDRSLEALAGDGDDRLQRLFQLIGLRFGAPMPTVTRLDASRHWLTQGFYDREQDRMTPLSTNAESFTLVENAVVVYSGAKMSMAAFDAAMPKMARSAAKAERAEAGVPAEDSPAIRTAFADTALWRGDAVTDHDGRLTLPFRLPDNVTSWRVHVWAKDGCRRVGVGETTLQTSKPLIVRPLSPRFLVASDEALLGATVHNGLDHEVAAQVTLALPEALLALESGTAARAVRVPAGGSARVEWRVRVKASGAARWSVTATTEEGSDGVEQTLPVRVYGAERQESVSGVLREGQSSAEVAFEVPERRRPETMRLEVTWTTSLAQSLLAAMPYLLAEPEGCTERTVSRLTSLLRVRQTLERLNMNLKDIAGAAALPPSSRPAWQRTATMAVFDDDELSRMVSRGLASLAALQCADGGWGWYPGFGERSDALMTALAVEGLLTARTCGLDVTAMLRRGLDWLERHQRTTLDRLKKGSAGSRSLELDARLHQVLCLAGCTSDAMGERLWRDRARLSPYGLALFAQAERAAGRRERQVELTSLLRQYVREDAESGMAWVDCDAFPHWLWQGDRIETQAAYLKLLLAQPQPDLRLASALVAHLLANRRHATYWNSTRDTAACIDALSDYLLASGELDPDAHVELFLDGRKVAESRFDATRLWTEPQSFVLTGAELTAGRHVLTLRRQGHGNLYYTSRLSGFSQEADLLPAGLEAKVSRAVFRLEQTLGKATFLPDREGHPVPVITPETRRLPLRDGDAVRPGDLLEVQMTLDAKFDLEYLQLDDPRIAGAEPLDALSGHSWQGLSAYRETRDDATRFYLQRLPQGRHQMTYQLRAETPGRFCALPAQLKAVYAPDIRGNSEAIRLKVKER